MREKKLTYYQIASLASEGKFDEIPVGYTFEWRPSPPGEFIDTEITPDNIQMSGNKPPMPDLVKFKADYIFDINSLFGGSKEKVDFGTIILRTIPHVTNFELVYDLTKRNDENEIMEWVRQYSDAVTGRMFKKADLVFDMEMKVGDSSTLHTYNTLLVRVDLPNEKDKNDALEIKMQFICDHWHFDF